MKPLFKYLFSSIFFFSYYYTIAQSNSFKISGKVVDEKNIPLEFVSVYINSTSIFASTDSLGRFTLNIPNNKVDFELVVSMVGFYIQKQKFTQQNAPKFLSIKLKSNNLAEVTIKAKQDRFWKRKWEIFKSGLLGDNSFSRQCSFENRENIHLSFDDTNHTVFANSSQTFIVTNNALGYKIHVDLYQFSSDGKNINYSALKYFEDALDSSRAEKQLANRKKAFASTPNFFLHCLANQKIEEANFEVFKIKSMVDIFLGRTTVKQQLEDGLLQKANISDIYKYDSLNRRNIIYSDLPLLIFNKNEFNSYKNPFLDYTYNFSKVVLPNFLAIFNDSGFLTVPNGITFHFQWGAEGLASSLPENYQIEKNDLPVNKIGPNLSLALEIEQVDSILAKTEILGDQSIGFQKSNTLELEKDDDYLMKPDYSFQPSELEKNLDIYTLLKRLPGLRVIQNVETGQYSISISGMNTNLSFDSRQDNTPALLMSKRIYIGSSDVLNALDSIETNRISEIGLVKYGNNAILGSRGGSGTIIIKFLK